MTFEIARNTITLTHTQTFNRQIDTYKYTVHKTHKFILDVCHERVDAGPCDQWQTRYYFNQDARRCEPFTYGGCQGNGNRFNSESECQSICITHEEPTNNQNKGKVAMEHDWLCGFLNIFL